MRVNIYSQELTNDVLAVKLESGNVTYSAIRLFLHSSHMLHQPPDHTGVKDDRSGITFWLPSNPDRREDLAKTFEEMARLVRKAPPESDR